MRYCIFCHSNIFFSLDFDTKLDALNYIKEHDLGSDYFIEKSWVLPL